MYDIEEFRDVVGYEDLYEVSNEGNVRNKITGRMLKPYYDKGYLKVVLYKNGEQKHCSIHRLVAQAFLPNPRNLPEVNHIDENKLNNNVENLEWCSRQYNIDYSQSKSVNQYTLEGGLLNTYKSVCEASRQTGIDQSSISSCCLGKRYKSAGGYIWKYVS